MEDQDRHDPQRDGTLLLTSHPRQVGSGHIPIVQVKDNDDDGNGGVPNHHSHVSPYDVRPPPPVMIPHPPRADKAKKYTATVVMASSANRSSIQPLIGSLEAADKLENAEVLMELDERPLRVE